MNAVWIRARSELRTYHQSAISLTLLVALGTTVVMAAAAGARRTDSAYPRFLREYRGADFFIDVPPIDQAPGFDTAPISRLPQVSAYEPVKRAFFFPVRGHFVQALARSQDPTKATVDRFKIVEGRAANPDDPGEVVLSLLGREVGLRIGDTFRAALPSGDPFTAFAAALAKDPITMRVVGVAAVPGGFPPQVSEVQPHMYLTPAFFRRFPNGFDGTAPSALFRLKGGSTAFRAFEAGITRVTGVRDIPFSELERRGQDANVQRSFHLQALALWLLAGLAALAFVLVLSQTLSRQVFLESDDFPTLSALGMSRVQLWTVGLARVGTAALAGALVALPAASAPSVLAPVGLARTAEPSPGFAVDWTVLGLGVAVAIFAVLAITTVPAWRAARLAARAQRYAEHQGASPPSAVAGLVARGGVGPSAVAGVRMALERGRGRTAIPVRSSIASVSLGITVLVAATTFGAGLHHLLDAPRLYGVPWDMAVTSDSEKNFAVEGARLTALPEVLGVSVGRWGLTTTIGGEDIETIALDSVAGTTEVPALLEGRAPSAQANSEGPLEIVLGTRTMRKLGLRIGQVVPARIGELDLKVPVRVVGRGVLPSFNESARLGDGGWVSYRASVERAGLDPTTPDGGANTAFLDLRPGVRHGSFLRKLAGYLGTTSEDDLFEPPVAKATDIVNFGRIRNMPEILGGVLLLFAASTLVHTLVSAVRRRRRDLAVLKTLGFVRGQVRRAVAVQATTLTLIALAIGLPVGVAVGRWLWASLANDLGVVSRPVVPLTTVLLSIPVALAIANLIAALPARSAARTQPATVLRSE